MCRKSFRTNQFFSLRHLFTNQLFEIKLCFYWWSLCLCTGHLFEPVLVELFWFSGRVCIRGLFGLLLVVSFGGCSFNY